MSNTVIISPLTEILVINTHMEPQVFYNSLKPHVSSLFLFSIGYLPTQKHSLLYLLISMPLYNEKQVCFICYL